MPGWIGPWELLLLLLVVLLVFGPKRLPEMGRSLGKGMREFKDSVTGKDEHLHEMLQPIPIPDAIVTEQSEPVAVLRDDLSTD